MIFVGAGLVPAHNGGKHKALPLQNVNDFLIGINSNWNLFLSRAIAANQKEVRRVPFWAYCINDSTAKYPSCSRVMLMSP